MSVPLRTRQRDLEDWLLSASSDPAAWHHGPVALVSCGKRFAAVRLPATVVQAAAQSTEQDEVDAYLRAALMSGPVICDRYAHWYYALVPVSAAERWDVAGTVCLGVGSTLGVPHPGDSDGRRDRVYWSVPVEAVGELCSPPAVSQVVALGTFRMLSR